MDRWIFPTILLCIPLCLGLLQNQGNQVFEPTNLRIYSNDSLQQLLLEWDVSDDSEAYNSQIDIIFNIQIRLREENERIILNVNYTTVLNKSRQLHQWGFISEVPLQCATHEARIRSKVVSSEIWSNWSYWVAAEGPDTLSDETNHFFPKNKVFERGSKITFCCIAKKNKSVSIFIIHNTLKFPERDRQRALLTLTPESSFPSRFQFGCFFSDSGNHLTITHLYLTSSYGEKNFTASDFPLTTGSTAERPFSFHPVASLFLALLVLALCQPQRTAACQGCHSSGCGGSGDAAAPMAPYSSAYLLATKQPEDPSPSFCSHHSSAAGTA